MQSGEFLYRAYWNLPRLGKSCTIRECVGLWMVSVQPFNFNGKITQQSSNELQRKILGRAGSYERQGQCY